MKKRKRKSAQARKPPNSRRKKGHLRVERISEKRGIYHAQASGEGFGGPLDILPGETVRSAAIRTLGAETRKASQIKLGRRHRKDFGNLAELARSIDDVGLLHAIVIDKRNKLIAGERRLRAWPMTKFHKLPIPVRVVDLDRIVAGEWHENAIRKDFTPSEAVAIKHELEPRLKREAAARKKSGRKIDDEKGRAADKAALVTGKSRRTIDKAEAIVAAAAEDPKKFGKLLTDMDRTGRVDGPFNRLKIMKQADAIRKLPPGVPMKGPYAVVVIDYPWPNEPDMTQAELDARGRSLRPYAAMSIAAGHDFLRDKVRKILAKDCVVYFWTTNFHMRIAFELLESLGFKKHSTIGTWVKDKLGRGQILRDRTEHCIIAIRGNPVINLTGMTPQATTEWRGVGWERRENSRKPVAFFKLVEQLTPATRYAEIFSTEIRGEKWDCHGDQVGKHAPITPALPMDLPEAVKPEDPPAAAAGDEDQAAEACRARLKQDFPDGVPGHVVTMTIDHKAGEDLGTCQCGAAFNFPREDLQRQMDLAIEKHWRGVAEQLEIPAFLKREQAPEPPANVTTLVNPKVLPTKKQITKVADRAEGAA